VVHRVFLVIIIKMNRPELQSPNNDVAVIQVLNGKGGVSNMNVNVRTGLDTPFSQSLGVTLPNVKCSTGVSNPDNVCICPASMNSSPFVPYPQEYRQTYMNALFSPIVSVPNPTPAAQMVADRWAQRIRQ
jgi:hypothetical protein